MKNVNEVEFLFTQKASTWNKKYSVNGPLRYRLDAFRKQLAELVIPPAEILDFGCGTGNLAGNLHACGYKVSACDISKAMIERAIESNPSLPVKWFVLPVNWFELPFRSNSFDAVVASSAFEYLTNLDAALAECWRALKPGGFLIATVPNSQNLIRRLENVLRPAAIIVCKIPILNRIPKVGSYTSYLKCSRNRMSLADWSAIGRRARFNALERSESSARNSALEFLRLQKR